MVLVNIFAVFVLVVSGLGGLREGAVKHFFNLLVMLVTVPLAGALYFIPAAPLSFLPGTNWQNFVGFFIALALISIPLHILFFFPRRTIQPLWKKGLLFRLVGGVLNLANAAIGLTVFSLVMATYPIMDWLAGAVTGASVMVWLVENLTFVRELLPEAFRQAGNITVLL